MPGVRRLEYRMANSSPANQLGSGVTTMLYSSSSGPTGFSGNDAEKGGIDESSPEMYAFLCMYGGRKQQKAPSLTISYSLARPFRSPRAASTKEE